MDQAGVPIAVRLRDDYESRRLNSGRISVNLSPPAPGQLAQCLVMLIGLNPWRGSLTDGVLSRTVPQEGRSMTEPLKRDTVESGSTRPSGDCRALGPSGTAGDDGTAAPMRSVGVHHGNGPAHRRWPLPWRSWTVPIRDLPVETLLA